VPKLFKIDCWFDKVAAEIKMVHNFLPHIVYPVVTCCWYC